MRIKSVFAIALSTLLLVTETAKAQTPPGTPTPSKFVDLGDVGLNANVDSGEVDLASGSYVWFRFKLTTAIHFDRSWLDIDTLSPNSITDNELALYDDQKNLIATNNNYGGSGTLNNKYAAAMSFGSGSGKRVSLSPYGGLVSDGITGTTLSPGVYWACIGAYSMDFPERNIAWAPTTNSAASGKVLLRVSTGAKPNDLWNERHNGADSGSTPADAAIPKGSGALTKILCSFPSSPKGYDIFKIRVCDPTVFAIVAESTSTTEWTISGKVVENWGSRLYLLDSAGNGVLGISRGARNTTRLAPIAGKPIQAGDYYVVVSSDCGGDNNMWAVPYSASGPMWDFGAVNANTIIAPNGSGANSPVQYYGRQSMCLSNNGYPLTMVVSLSLIGCCYADEDCSADLNKDNFVNDDDFSQFIGQYDRLICP
ncbi:MAG: hypothetical protein K2Y21_04560 [Phycisphaerales bacterium]|nr:hypothetical protein [Phycisphaerales bacterium]